MEVVPALASEAPPVAISDTPVEVEETSADEPAVDVAASESTGVSTDSPGPSALLRAQTEAVSAEEPPAREVPDDTAVRAQAAPEESAPPASIPVEVEVEDDGDDSADLAASDQEPATTELRRPPAGPQPPSAAIAIASGPVGEWRESKPSDRPPANRDDSDIQTKPKIRLPGESGARAVSGSPSRPAEDGTVTGAQPVNKNGRGKSSVPPPPVARVKSSPLPPAPAGHSVRPAALSGEGIVRTTPLPRPPEPIQLAQRDSDVPTRPRIPLTHDMALVAGRITSQEVSPYADDMSARPRGSLVGDPPAVIVTRAHVISDPPPANGLTADVFVGRPSRRPARPDSEEFETLDLDDGDEMARVENKTISGSVSAVSGEVNVRVPRTPPPPPTQQPGKRANTGQFATNQRAAPPPPPPTAAPKRAPAPTKAQRPQPKKRAWWEVLFSDDYIRTLPRPSSAAIAKQVAFMESSLGIKRGDAVLDVGCGLGHHALEFAKRGYLVVALDLALSMITRAAEEAQQRGLRINFLHKDIRDIGFEGTFDAIICVGTTFGFFDDEQNRGVLQRLAHALKPGGRLLLDVVNRDYVVNSQPNLVWFEGENCVVMEESDFNYYSSRLSVKRTMMRDDGRQSDIEYNLRLYSVHELGQMLKQCGFSIKEVSGQEATRGLFFGAHSMRIIVLAERRVPGKKSDSMRPSNE